MREVSVSVADGEDGMEWSLLPHVLCSCTHTHARFVAAMVTNEEEALEADVVP